MCNTSVKILTKEQLIAFNNRAIEYQRENFLSRGTITPLPEEARFPVLGTTHLHQCITLDIGLTQEGKTSLLDVSQEDYDSLDSFSVDSEIYDVLEEMYDNETGIEYQ